MQIIKLLGNLFRDTALPPLPEWEETAEKMLTTNKQIRQEFEHRKQEDASFATDRRAQLMFLYQRSKHNEASFMRYPVVRLQSLPNSKSDQQDWSDRDQIHRMLSRRGTLPNAEKSTKILSKKRVLARWSLPQNYRNFGICFQKAPINMRQYWKQALDVSLPTDKRLE